MIRRAAIPLGAATLGLVVALGYVYVTRTSDERPQPGNQPSHSSETALAPSAFGSQSNAAQASAQGATAPRTIQPGAPSPATDSAETIQRLTVEARSPDPQARAKAIEALADMPKASAIPVLEQILETGEPGTDRQVALQSLYTLALKQGDEDQRIRSVLRGAIYHGDDEETSQSAQALLEDIETELAQRVSNP